MSKRVRRKSYKKNTLHRRNTMKRRRNTLRRRNTMKRRRNTTKRRRNTTKRRRNTMRGGSPVTSPTIDMYIITKNRDDQYNTVFVYRTTDEIENGLDPNDKGATMYNNVKGRVIEGVQDITTNTGEVKKMCKVHFDSISLDHYELSDLYVGIDNIIPMKNLTATHAANNTGHEWVAKKFWTDGTNCSICDAEFWTIERKHHCRTCGEIVCNDCSTNNFIYMIPKKYTWSKTYTGKNRECDKCFYPDPIPNAFE